MNDHVEPGPAEAPGFSVDAPAIPGMSDVSGSHVEPGLSRPANVTDGQRKTMNAPVEPGPADAPVLTATSTDPSVENRNQVKPRGKPSSSFNSFIALPSTDTYCSAVDAKLGLWFCCKACDIQVPNRQDRVFTIGRWNEHKSIGVHKTAVSNFKNLKILKLKKKKNRGHDLSSLEENALKQGKKFSVSIMSHYKKASDNKTKYPRVRASLYLLPLPRQNRQAQKLQPYVHPKLWVMKQ